MTRSVTAQRPSISVVATVATSGNPVRMQMLLDRLLAMSTRPDIRVVDNPAFMKPDAIPFLVGDPTKVRCVLGWQQKRSLDRMLADVLDDCRKQVRAGM